MLFRACSSRLLLDDSIAAISSLMCLSLASNTTRCSSRSSVSVNECGGIKCED